MPKYSVYIDTTILGNWILYQQKRDKVKQSGERIIESYALLERIEKGCPNYTFQTSTWAMSELAGIIVDNLLAEQMLKDGIALTEFSSQRRVYRIKEENTKRAIVENLAAFSDLLKRLTMKPRSFEIDDDSVTDLLFKHTFLPIPDAVHLSFAIRSCDIFLTLDQRHFLDKERRKEIQDTNNIRILRPYELLEIIKQSERNKVPRTINVRVKVDQKATEKAN